MSSFTKQYLAETIEIVSALDVGRSTPWPTAWPPCASRGGRLFILGVGGSAGHAGHAVNDFRKLCAFEAYAPTDNVSELTARTNDEGWDTTFSAWLEGSRLRADDGLLVFSVGGGDAERNVSAEHRARAAAGRERGAVGLRHRRTGRRLHRPGRRRRRRDPTPRPGSHHAAHRRALRRRVAPARLPSRAQGARRRSGSRSPGGPLSDARASAPRSSSSAAPGSSAATPSTACSDAAGLERVTVFDNFTSGRWWHLEHHRDDPRLDVVEADVKDLDALTKAMAGHDARHPSRVEPGHRRGDGGSDDRLRRGHAADPPRRRGDAPQRRAEDRSTPPAAASTATSARSRPTRTTARSCRRRRTARPSSPARRCCARTPTCSAPQVSAFRFGNVVGPRQTHGVGFDFLRRLRDDPTRLRILGDGRQSKSYIHVLDVLDAVFHAASRQEARTAPTTSRPATTSRLRRSPSWRSRSPGSTRTTSRWSTPVALAGWKGDVPVVRLDTTKIEATGMAMLAADPEALRQSMLAMLGDGERLGW